MPKPWELDWSQPQPPSTPKPWERDWSAPDNPKLPAFDPVAAAARQLDLDVSASNRHATSGKVQTSMGDVPASGVARYSTVNLTAEPPAPMKPNVSPVSNPAWLAYRAVDALKRGAESPTPEWQRGMYEAKFGKPAPSNLGAAFREPAKQMASGIEDISKAGSVDQAAGGASKIVRGTLDAYSGPEVMAPVAIAAPVQLVTGMVAGTASGKTAKATAKALGAGEGVSDLAEDMVGFGVGMAAGAKTPSAGKIKAKVKEYTKTDPYPALARVFRGAPTADTLLPILPETLTIIQSGNPGVELHGVTKGRLNIIDAANKSLDQNQASLNRWLFQKRGTKVSGDALVKAAKDAIPELEWRTDPEGSAAIVADAERAFGGKEFGVSELRDFLRTKNAQDSSFWRKSSPRQQQANTAGEPSAIDVAVTDAMRNELYRALDPPNNGAGPREIQRQAGNIIKFRDAIIRRNNAIVAEQSLSKVGEYADAAKRWARALWPGKATGSGIAYAEGSEGRSLPLLKRALKSVKGEKPPELPQPPEISIAGLLPRGNAQFSAGGVIVPDVLGRPDLRVPYNAGLLEAPAPGPQIPSSGRTFYVGAPGQVPEWGVPAGKATAPKSTVFDASGKESQGRPYTSPGRIIDMRGRGTGEFVPVEDTSSVGSMNPPPMLQTPQPEPGVIPPSRAASVIDRNTQPAPHGGPGPAYEWWWSQQPPTKAELQLRYEQLFNRAENLSPQRPVRVPETGVPEGVARGVDARENVARQVLNGRKLKDATPTELRVIDELIAEGYGSVPKYAKGGIITRPTLLVDAETKRPTGLMAEEGPEAIVPLEKLVEQPDSLTTQLDELANLKRRVVKIPKGSFPRSTPDGMVTHADQEGNRFVFNPNLISKNDIKVAIKMNRLPHILNAAGSSQSHLKRSMKQAKRVAPRQTS